MHNATERSFWFSGPCCLVVVGLVGSPSLLRTVFLLYVGLRTLHNDERKKFPHTILWAQLTVKNPLVGARFGML